MNRSIEPNGARWIITGRCGVVVGADVFEAEPLAAGCSRAARCRAATRGRCSRGRRSRSSARRTPLRPARSHVGHAHRLARPLRATALGPVPVFRRCRRTCRSSDRGSRAARGSRSGRALSSTICVISMQPRNSSATCSSVQKRWASSWVKPRTRVMPFSSPDLLEAVDGAELGQPHRQVAVAARLRLVDLDVVRAVHRLEQVPLAVLDISIGGNWLSL